jgi:transcriptional regulator with XRE-family HTH domain
MEGMSVTAMSRTATAALGTMGTRIELRRRALEWSIEDTAARLGVNPRTVRAVELGRPTVKVGTVFAYADLVGVRLFGLEGDELVRARRVGEDTLALLPALTPGPDRTALDDEEGF